jgi:hypothetical protein
MVIFALHGCDDDPEVSGSGAGGSSSSSSSSSTSASGSGGSGGAPTCLGLLQVTDEPGNAHAPLCIACLERECCGALAACGADPVCLSCVENPSQPVCGMNAAALDLGQCAVDQCEGSACLCIGCSCIDDGMCDIPGSELCHCADCTDHPGCNDGCNHDGKCDDLDACTCPDCYELCGDQCNGDAYCDEYHEACVCSDCAEQSACDRGSGGIGGRGGMNGSGGMGGA